MLISQEGILRNCEQGDGAPVEILRPLGFTAAQFQHKFLFGQQDR